MKKRHWGLVLLFVLLAPWPAGDVTQRTGREPPIVATPGANAAVPGRRPLPVVIGRQSGAAAQDDYVPGQLLVLALALSSSSVFTLRDRFGLRQFGNAGGDVRADAACLAKTRQAVVYLSIGISKALGQLSIGGWVILRPVSTTGSKNP